MYVIYFHSPMNLGKKHQKLCSHMCRKALPNKCIYNIGIVDGKFKCMARVLVKVMQEADCIDYFEDKILYIVVF